MASRWPRAWGDACGSGLLRRQPSHFQVDELLSFEPSGSGEHVLLQIRKSGENTLWVARDLARLAGVKSRDVGYAGLKDRHARTTQWFSVGLAGRPEPDWRQLDSDSVQVLRAERHHRKLRTGALAANRFEITVAEYSGDPALTADRLAVMSREGIPNYFGEQRFGRDGENPGKALAMFSGELKVRDRKMRGIYLSAARSWLFNELLAKRVAGKSWNRLLEGEVLNLDGRSAVFALQEPADEALLRRLGNLELHPTGALWGQGDSLATADVKQLEEDVARENPGFAQGLERAGLKQERRPLRMRLAGLDFEQDADSLRLVFTLRSGSYATSVLREMVDYSAR